MQRHSSQPLFSELYSNSRSAQKFKTSALNGHWIKFSCLIPLRHTADKIQANWVNPNEKSNFRFCPFLIMLTVKGLFSDVCLSVASVLDILAINYLFASSYEQLPASIKNSGSFHHAHGSCDKLLALNQIKLNSQNQFSDSSIHKYDFKICFPWILKLDIIVSVDSLPN